MIKLFAPYPDYRIVIFLPNPEWGDIQRLESSTQLKRSMNGVTTVTHNRVLAGVRTYELSIVLTRLKSLEFMSFFQLFGAEKMRLVLHNATEKIGYIRLNPLELEIIKRAIMRSSIEEVTIRIDFESLS